MSATARFHGTDPRNWPPAPRDVLALLAGMVGFDTINSDLTGRTAVEIPLALWLEHLAQERGLHTRRLPLDDGSINLLITTHDPAVKDAGPWMLLESHLDTVRIDGMTIDPFAGDVRAGKLWGRGASDTKSSGAAMLWALFQFAAQPQRSHPRNAGVLLACGEEHHKSGANAFAKQHLPTLGTRPTAMVVGEPTMLRQVAAHNGVVRWIVRTTGVSAHSSNPAAGKSAISLMLRVIDTIEKQYIAPLRTVHPLTGKAQCSINVIRGGVQINLIPEKCEIEIDRRIIPGEDPATVLPAIERILAPLRQPNADITQTLLLSDPALNPQGTRGSEALIHLTSNILCNLGVNGDPCGAPYGTDASTYCDVGIPSIVLGPGDIAQAHTCDEWVAVEQVERAVTVYQALLNGPLENVR